MYKLEDFSMEPNIALKARLPYLVDYHIQTTIFSNRACQVSDFTFPYENVGISNTETASLHQKLAYCIADVMKIAGELYHVFVCVFKLYLKI